MLNHKVRGNVSLSCVFVSGYCTTHDTIQQKQKQQQKAKQLNSPYAVFKFQVYNNAPRQKEMFEERFVRKCFEFPSCA